jgi:hypothetical protein
VRVLDALSRFDQTPDSLVIELTDAGYIALGDAEAVATTEARAAILNTAPTSEGEALREADLLSAADVKRTVGQGVIREHLEAGRLCRMGKGKKGDPYRYWRAPEGEKVTAGTPVVPAERNGQSDHVVDLDSAAPTNEVLAESIAVRDISRLSSTKADAVTERAQSDPLLSAGAAASSATERNDHGDTEVEVGVEESCGKRLLGGDSDTGSPAHSVWSERSDGDPCAEGLQSEGPTEPSDLVPPGCGKPVICNILGPCPGYQATSNCPLSAAIECEPAA